MLSFLLLKTNSVDNYECFQLEKNGRMKWRTPCHHCVSGAHLYLSAQQGVLLGR